MPHLCPVFPPSHYMSVRFRSGLGVAQNFFLYNHTTWASPRKLLFFTLIKRQIQRFWDVFYTMSDPLSVCPVPVWGWGLRPDTGHRCGICLYIWYCLCISWVLREYHDAEPIILSVGGMYAVYVLWYFKIRWNICASQLDQLPLVCPSLCFPEYGCHFMISMLIRIIGVS